MRLFFIMKFAFLNRAIRKYMLFVHNHIFYRSVEWEGKENIPTDGSGIIVAANHQNAICGPFLTQFMYGTRQINVFAMGKAFSIPVLGSLMRWFGVMPAYRMRTDGVENVSRNGEAFNIAAEKLLNGETVVIYPEATNQVRRWLGEFSLGYLKLAFGAAEKGGFEKEIKIVPAAEHFNDYFRWQGRALLRFGEPVALSPYYELYREKPRQACREVNNIVRERVHELMLDVRDDENYEAIDRILQKDRQNNERSMLENLKAEQARLAEIENMQADDRRVLFERALNGEFDEKRHVTPWYVLMKVLLFPLFLISMVPNGLVLLLPEPLVRKIGRLGEKFRMFTSGIRYVVSGFIGIPVVYGVTFILECVFVSWWFALVHLLLLPWLLVFGVRYIKDF